MRALFSSLLVFAVVVASSSPASGYKLQGPAWDIERGPVVYSLHRDGCDDVSDGTDLDEVRGAFQLWSCVEGSGLRFLEGDSPGEKVESLTDGKNNVFWDESGAFGLGPATFSVTRTTPFVPEQPAVRDAADIILNGTDHVWTTGTPSEQDTLPIFNVVLREIGVLAGLDVECLDDNDPNTCPGPDDTVMSPFVPGAPREALLPDDEEAVLALYATDDGSSCEGPFRQAEPCSCNDDCVDGMICAPDTDGKDVCSPVCSSENTDCPTGFSCVLAARADDEDSAFGQCVSIGSSGLFPVTATCENDRQCAEGLCASIPAIGRTGCRVSCDSDDECPSSYACSDGHCTWAGEAGGLSCELPPGDDIVGCGCTSSSSTTPPLILGALALLFGAAARSRRRRRQRS